MSVEVDGHSVVLNRMAKKSIEKIALELRLEEGERIGHMIEKWPKEKKH